MATEAVALCVPSVTVYVKPPVVVSRSHQYGAGVTVRSVRSNGEIRWKGDMVYVSEAVRGEPIALVQQDERTWSIEFGPLLIGILDDPERRIDKTTAKVLPMSPV